MNLDAILRIAAKVTGTEAVQALSKAVGAAGRTADGAKASFKNVVNSSAWQGAAVVATGIGVALGVATRAAIDFESSVADVQKVVQGIDTPAALTEIRQEILQLSREMPITAEGFAEIYAAAGQAGIPRAEIRAFAIDVAKMGVAFDISAEDAGNAMAKIRASLGLSQPEVLSLADALNHLSNNTASTGAELVDFIQRSGAAGKMAGLTAEQTAAFGAAMIGAGAETQVAATSFNNMIRALSKGESATSRQVDGFARLGLSAADMAKRLQDDAIGTIMDVFKRIAALPKEMQISTLSDIFGDEARALAPLISNLGNLETALGLVADQSQYAGSMTKEYETRSQTAANALILLQNNLTALAIEIGAAILPALNLMVQALTPVIAGISRLASMSPALTGLAVAVVALGSAFVIAAPFIAAAVSVVTTLGPVLLAAKAAAVGLAATIAGWAGVIGPAIVAIKAIITTAAAVVAGFITWPVLIGAAIVAAVALIWTFRDDIGKFFQWLSQAAVDGWNGLMEPLAGVLETAGQAISDAWEWIKGAMAAGWAAIVEASYALFVQPWVDLWTAIQPAVTGFWEWIKSVFNTAWTALLAIGYMLFIAPWVLLWDKVKEPVGAAWEWIKRAALQAWGAIISTAYSLFVQPWITLWKRIESTVSDAWRWIISAAPPAWNAIISTAYNLFVKPWVTLWSNGIRGPVTSGLEWLQGKWKSIGDFFAANVTRPIQSAWSGMVGNLQQAWERISEFLPRMIQGAANKVKDILSGVAGSIANGINSVIRQINGLIQSFNRVAAATKNPFRISEIKEVAVPKFARGGFVTGPTLGMLGDNRSGREYAVPEEKVVGFANNIMAGRRGAAAIPSGAGGGGSSGGSVTVNITTGPLMQIEGRSYATLDDLESAARQTATQIYATLRTPAGRRAIGVDR